MNCTFYPEFFGAWISDLESTLDFQISFKPSYLLPFRQRHWTLHFIYFIFILDIRSVIGDLENPPISNVTYIDRNAERVVQRVNNRTSKYSSDTRNIIFTRQSRLRRSNQYIRASSSIISTEFNQTALHTHTHTRVRACTSVFIYIHTHIYVHIYNQVIKSKIIWEYSEHRETREAQRSAENDIPGRALKELLRGYVLHVCSRQIGHTADDTAKPCLSLFFGAVSISTSPLSFAPRSWATPTVELCSTLANSQVFINAN